MGLYYLLLATANPGDNILVPEPSYPFYHKNAPSIGVQIRPYQLLPQQNWEIDFEQLEKLIDQKTRFLWIVNPSNPCGSIFSEQHMSEIFSFCKKKSIFIISDEVYWNESFSDQKFISFGHFQQDDVPVVVIGGFEKTFLVPGWSFSWIIFFDKNYKLKNIKFGVDSIYQIFLNPCSFLIHSVPEILDTLTADYTKNQMVHFEENYNFLFKQLKEIQGLQPIKSQGTFYLVVLIQLEFFPDFKNDQEFLQGLLNQENICILNLSSFNGKYQGFRMLTCATIDGHYNQFIVRIKRFCIQHYNKV
ncbi:tyrosine aminotransferase, putative [Ichthyophthirius multifiliis]|uniref:Tyrosine aminotransferase, putative n=1 Tax=Ichthyophthirius multifiliis TaxID=5932 RepID=G0QZN8_ICHMU|nr:tyrosine aminotransferase, putative [Ichthyophthirius multifiliis]EGR29312.1 tyrosine aminotransferase, putative [Ichthyophthirius multifiliis]|eukprot:XP_004030548.1 tyrosine aminotransferase, putative [Ichthyophthirius multifiliis]